VVAVLCFYEILVVSDGVTEQDIGQTGLLRSIASFRSSLASCSSRLSFNLGRRRIFSTFAMVYLPRP
jgi:hypothetical protein